MPVAPSTIARSPFRASGEQSRRAGHGGDLEGAREDHAVGREAAVLGDDRGDLVHLELGEDRRQQLLDDDHRAPLHRLEVVADAEQALHHALAHVGDVGPALPEIRILDPLEGVAIGVEDLAQGVARVAGLVDRLARRSGRSPCPRGSGSGCGRPPRTRGRSGPARRRASRRSRAAPRTSRPRNPRAPSSTSAAGTYSILSRSIWRSIRKIGPIATPRAVASPRSVDVLVLSLDRAATPPRVRRSPASAIRATMWPRWSSPDAIRSSSCAFTTTGASSEAQVCSSSMSASSKRRGLDGLDHDHADHGALDDERRREQRREALLSGLGEIAVARVLAGVLDRDRLAALGGEADEALRRSASRRSRRRRRRGRWWRRGSASRCSASIV